MPFSVRTPALVLTPFLLLSAAPGVLGTQAPLAALPSVSAVVQRVQPSVVSIAGPSGALGSGFVARVDGLVVTNRHVVDAGGTTVVLPSGERLAARVRTRHADQDLAVLELLTPRTLPALPLADGEPEVGDWVLAVGNPFGLGLTVSIGIVGATGRSLGRSGVAAGLLQTDAAINPGNSGGPLCDLTGAVVGIASSAITVGQGIGFALPIRLVREMLGSVP